MKNIDLRSKNSNIFIIGKGRSIDDIDQGTLHNSIVINLNDSFELVQGDIIIANRSWALEDSVKIPLKTVVVVEKKLVPDLPLNMSLCVLDRAILSGQNDDLLMHRFINKEIAFEDLLFVTALKVAYELAKQHSKKYNVYILGLDFDFDTLDSYSSKKLTDKSGESEDYKRKILAYQESVLNQFLYIYR
jgi:N-acetylneuraminate synthase